MPLLATKYFGSVPCESTDLFSFPAGIPGFDEQNSFALMSVPGKSPLVLLQSASQRQLCFPALPVHVIDPEYELTVSFEDLTILEFAPDHRPRVGSEVLVLALLTMTDGEPATANLLAPVVINLAKQLGVQAIRSDCKYSHQHPVLAQARVC